MDSIVLATNPESAGLGNRVRFTLSALSLARTNSRDFMYVWPQSKNFEPAFSDLWNFNEKIATIEQLNISKTLPCYQKSEDLPDHANKIPIWHFRSHHELKLPIGAPTWGSILRGLEPAKNISNRVCSFFDNHLKDKNYIGVMIRAHEKSHTKTLEKSPIEWFLEKIAELDRKNPGIIFFLSCDVPKVQLEITQKFPNCIGQIAKGEYGSVEGIISSVVDLYLLASASYMLTPFWSTFPDIALELADKKIAFQNSCYESGKFSDANSTLTLNPLKPAERTPSLK